MFELLFKYPGSLFQRGEFVLLAPWPLWALGLAILAAGAALFWHARRHGGALGSARAVAIWALQTVLLALILLLLWRPAISVATLRPQQNVVAVVVDDSRSMALADGGSARMAQAREVLEGGLLASLGDRFQVRLYRLGRDVERIQNIGQLNGEASATRIAAGLEQILSESSTLPLGAVVLLSDGAENSGGIGLETISEIRRRRIPVHTVGFGRERPERDIEIADVALPGRALPDSRLNAQVSFRHYGLDGQKARVAVRDGDKVLATEEVAMKGDGAVQTHALAFDAGAAGPKSLRFSIEPLAGEENRENNTVTRLLHVRETKPRILYIEGEPRWDFKFIRRAAEEDRSLELVTMLRTTQNKIYRQGIASAQELEEGFPAKAEELFAYQGLIVGGVEAGYFTPAQQQLIREFASRRGGGVLFLGGRFALSEGGWQHSPLAELLPLTLSAAKGGFHRDQTPQELTAAGLASVICRLEEDGARNVERWKNMPLLADYNETGEAKPGALVLMESAPQGSRKMPLLAVQNYGRGRAAVFATAGSWRWKMLQDHADRSHHVFWQQLMRYLVNETPAQVTGGTPQKVLSDDGRVELRADVRDKEFKARADVSVEARIIGPDGAARTAELAPRPLEEGAYAAEWNAEQPGSYVVEVVARRGEEEIGRDVFQFRREDGAAEHFGTSQNRELLEKLAQQTGGGYFTASNAGKLGEEISYSEAGITTRETKDLWNMPAVFLLALLLRGSEWVLRRKWGVI
jgi:uncharacterized membrane protein